jgi:hypothetical protein
MQFHQGGRRLYEWEGLRAKDEIPRIAEGKYQKAALRSPRQTRDAERGQDEAGPHALFMISIDSLRVLISPGKKNGPEGLSFPARW